MAAAQALFYTVMRFVGEIFFSFRCILRGFFRFCIWYASLLSKLPALTSSLNPLNHSHVQMAYSSVGKALYGLTMAGAVVAAFLTKVYMMRVYRYHLPGMTIHAPLSPKLG